jgi:hypothetical protein
MELILVKFAALACALLGVFFGILTIKKLYDLAYCEISNSFIERQLPFIILVRPSKSDREKMIKISIWKYMMLAIIMGFIQLNFILILIELEK